MATILYVTQSIAPFVVGGMQEVSRRHISYLRGKGHEVVAFHSQMDGPRQGDIHSGLHHIPWPQFSLRYPGRYPHTLYRLSRLVAEWLPKIKPDIIYAEGPVVGHIFSIKNRPPIIFHPHGLESLQEKFKIRHIFLKRLILQHCKKADIVISQGGDLDRLLSNNTRVKASCVRYLPNSFDGPLASAKLPPKNRRLLFVGRREKRKNLNFLLNICAQYPEIKLDVVGCSAIAEVGENIKFHGEIRDSQRLLKLYRQAHLLVLPSLAEGMPTVVLESMSQGTPVVANSVGAVMDVVVPGKTGWLVAVGNRDGMLQALFAGLSLDSYHYQKMSANCVAAVKHSYSKEVVQDILNSIVIQEVELPIL
ncbi:MAG: glycosyltransferase family 4 protein [Magnetococcales bacterium]|nr:glycosyltransferase family 4 protein [Magnetococcales bacterium]